MAFAPRLAGTAVALGVGGSLLAASLYNVDAGHRAVIYDRFQGVKNVVKEEGTHLLLPLLQRAIVYDVRYVQQNVNKNQKTHETKMFENTQHCRHDRKVGKFLKFQTFSRYSHNNTHVGYKKKNKTNKTNKNLILLIEHDLIW